MDELDEGQIDLKNSNEDFTHYDVMTLCELVEEYREDIQTAEKEISTLSDELSAAKTQILLQSDQLAESQRHIYNLEESVCVLDEEWAGMDDTFQKVLCLLDARSPPGDVLRGLRSVMGVDEQGEDNDFEDAEDCKEDLVNKENVTTGDEKEGKDKSGRHIEGRGEKLSAQSRFELQEAREEITFLREKEKDRSNIDIKLKEKEAELNDEVKFLKRKLKALERENEEAKAVPTGEIDSSQYRHRNIDIESNRHDRDSLRGDSITSVNSNDEEDDDEEKVIVTVPYRRNPNRLAAPDSTSTRRFSRSSYSNDGSTSMISNDESMISNESANEKNFSTGLLEEEWDEVEQKGPDRDGPEKPLINHNFHSPSKTGKSVPGKRGPVVLEALRRARQHVSKGKSTKVQCSRDMDDIGYSRLSADSIRLSNDDSPLHSPAKVKGVQHQEQRSQDRERNQSIDSIRLSNDDSPFHSPAKIKGTQEQNLDQERQLHYGLQQHQQQQQQRQQYANKYHQKHPEHHPQEELLKQHQDWLLTSENSPDKSKIQNSRYSKPLNFSHPLLSFDGEGEGGGSFFDKSDLRHSDKKSNSNGYEYISHRTAQSRNAYINSTGPALSDSHSALIDSPIHVKVRNNTSGRDKDIREKNLNILSTMKGVTARNRVASRSLIDGSSNKGYDASTDHNKQNLKKSISDLEIDDM